MCNLFYIINAFKLLYLRWRIDEQLCWRSKELPPEIQATIFNVKTFILILGRHLCLSVKSVHSLAMSNHSCNVDSLGWWVDASRRIIIGFIEGARWSSGIMLPLALAAAVRVPLLPHRAATLDKSLTSLVCSLDKRLSGC